MGKIHGSKVEPGIWRLAPRKFILEAHVDGCGRVRETCEGTLYEARTRLEGLKKQIREKKPENGRSLTFEKVRDVLEYYKEHHFQFTPRYKASKSIYQTLLKELGELPISELSQDSFNTWLRTIETTKSVHKRTPRPATINNYIKIVKSAFNFCQERGSVATNPISKMKLRPELNIQRRIVSFEEFMALYREVPSHLQPWLEFIYKVPTRRGEVISLRNSEDISLSEQKLYLLDGESKTEEGRVFCIPSSMMDYFRNIPPESKRVFFRPEQTSQGMVYHPLRGNGVLQALTRAAERLKMKGINVHMFRRTAAVNMIRSGVDIKTVQVAGGWLSLEVLMDRYLPLGDEDVKKAVDKVDVPIDRLKLSA